jgi:hypothetical protein
VSFAAITICVASQRVFFVVVYFVIDSVLKLLDIPSSTCTGEASVLDIGRDSTALTDIFIVLLIFSK